MPGIEFNLPSVNITVTLNQMVTLLTGKSENDINIPNTIEVRIPRSGLMGKYVDGSGSAHGDLSNSEYLGVFAFHVDSTDFDDTDINDVKFKTHFKDWSDNLAQYSIADGSVINSSVLNVGTPTTKLDIIRYIAKHIFGTPLAVDIFSNEVAIVQSIKNLDQTIHTNIMNVIEDSSGGTNGAHKVSPASSGTIIHGYDGPEPHWSSGKRWLWNDSSTFFIINSETTAQWSYFNNNQIPNNNLPYFESIGNNEYKIIKINTTEDDYDNVSFGGQFQFSKFYPLTKYLLYPHGNNLFEMAQFMAHPETANTGTSLNRNNPGIGFNSDPSSGLIPSFDDDDNTIWNWPTNDSTTYDLEWNGTSGNAQYWTEIEEETLSNKLFDQLVNMKDENFVKTGLIRLGNFMSGMTTDDLGTNDNPKFISIPFEDGDSINIKLTYSFDDAVSSQINGAIIPPITYKLKFLIKDNI